MSAATVTNLRPGRMTEAEFDRERAELRERYGDSSIEAVAKRDQALAILFYRSGWTQDELAKKEVRSQQRVGQSLRFGRFLNFTTGVVNPESLPKNLTEGRFRSYWKQTDQSDTNERTRFREVARLMKEELALVRPRRASIAQDIVKQFGDGKWHQVETIATKLAAVVDDEVTAEHVEATLVHMQWGRGPHGGAKCERKRVGKTFQYRVFPSEKTISSIELIEKLGPIISGLKEEGKKNMYTMSPGTVARLAGLLQHQLDEWTK